MDIGSKQIIPIPFGHSIGGAWTVGSAAHGNLSQSLWYLEFFNLEFFN